MKAKIEEFEKMARQKGADRVSVFRKHITVSFPCLDLANRFVKGMGWGEASAYPGSERARVIFRF